MTYYYTVEKEDLKKMGLKPTGAKYYGLEQNGWTCTFGDLHEILENKHGEFKGKVIAASKDLTEIQTDYITYNGHYAEY